MKSNFRVLLCLLMLGAFWSLTSVKAAISTRSTTVITIEPAKKYQIMEGWGTSLAWWANIVGGFDMPGKNPHHTVRDEIIDLVFDNEKGLGLNIVRYCIGGGCNSKACGTYGDEKKPHHIKRIEAIIPAYKSKPDGQYNWHADKNQTWVLKSAIEKRKNLGDDIIIEGFAKSPPWWMTESSCASGNWNARVNNLKPEYFTAYSRYLADIIEYFFYELEIGFDYFNPLNESASGYWSAKSSKQEGCHFSPGESQSKMYLALYEELRKKGLHNVIRLSGTDDDSVNQTIKSWNMLSADAKRTIAKINTHLYGGGIKSDLRDLAAAHKRPLWMSEWSTGYTRHDTEAMNLSAINLSKSIIQDIKEMQVSAWVIWQAVESKLENLRLKNSSGNWGLIHAVYEETPVAGYHIYQDGNKKPIDMRELGIKRGDYFIAKQYYVLGQFSKFIKPGYIIIDTDDDHSLAAISPNQDEIVFVLLNEARHSKSNTFYLSTVKNANTNVAVYRTSKSEGLKRLQDISLVAEKYIEDTVPAESITTYIVKARDGYKLYEGETEND